ncbi:MAG TPA: glycosyltransferase 87 family protein, partial [Candidatus Nitrosocosmicus sp.]|nr:glycosyltransferase 87 family protein [Candidatus Nitrosocosmicus sp.]
TPFFLFLVFPFSFLPYEAAEFVWLWLNIIAVVPAIIAVKRGFEKTATNPRRIYLILFLSFLVCAKLFFPLIRNLNVHLLILCLIFGAFYLLLKQKKLLAALLMALAITVKIVPVLTLPYFALKKQWLFLSATVVLVVVFNLLPAFYFGADLNFKLLNDWYNHVLVNNEFHEINGPLNLSLKGQLERYMVGVDYTKRTFDPDYQNINLFSISKNQADWIWKISVLAMSVGTLFLIWFSSKLRNNIYFSNHNTEKLVESKENLSTRMPNQFDSFAYHEFGLMICLSLLIAPRSNGYYFLALFFPLIPFIHTVFRNKSKFNILAFGLILTLTCLLPLIPGRSFQRLFLVLGVDFYTALILWIALAYNLYKESHNVRNKFVEVIE